MWKQSLLLYEDNYKDTVTCIILWLDNNFYMGCKQYLTLWKVSTLWTYDASSPSPWQSRRQAKTPALVLKSPKEVGYPDGEPQN